MLDGSICEFCFWQMYCTTHDYEVLLMISHEVGLLWDFTRPKSERNPSAVTSKTWVLAFRSRIMPNSDNYWLVTHVIFLPISHGSVSYSYSIICDIKPGLSQNCKIAEASKTADILLEFTMKSIMYSVKWSRPRKILSYIANISNISTKATTLRSPLPLPSNKPISPF